MYNAFLWIILCAKWQQSYSPSKGPKSEARNPCLPAGRQNSKQSQMAKFQMFQTKEFREFEF
jgi:hypothetical protein